jgi:sigma-B regulation protein RsbU (phosphoserine phosphatase)
MDYLRTGALTSGRLAQLEELVSKSLNKMPIGSLNCKVLIYRLSHGGEGESGDAYYQVSSVPDRASSSRKGNAIAPPWLKGEFAGFTHKEGRVDWTSVYDIGDGYRLVYQLPFDGRLTDYLRSRTSIELEVTPANPDDHPEEFELARSRISSKQSAFALTWTHFFRPVAWTTGDSARSWSILLAMPVSTVLEQFFTPGTESMKVIILLLLFAFIAVELSSLMIGVAIARSITRSIHSIYTGTQNIQEGNFGFRIPSRDRDQLDAMAESFNEMSVSIRRLLEQVGAREWLEKELEIAREVQNQLFPQQAPAVKGLEIAASCNPALQVSGDFYDFLSQGAHDLDIVVGDISGKGISAALLMASLHSAIRSSLSETSQDGDQVRRMAKVVRGVNQQLYRRTSPESYSTLVLAHYEADTNTLSYCNAGHHPPLVFSEAEVSRLTAGGTVVGLFEKWDFRGDSAQLSAGNVVLFYTDGIIEASNSKGEQFGTDRLIEIVRSNAFLTAHDIQALLVEQVFDWIGSCDQADDMTVVCVKLRE